MNFSMVRINIYLGHELIILISLQMDCKGKENQLAQQLE